MVLSKPKRSEVWLVDFDDVRKDEVGKIRPALIIQADDINKYYTSTIVVPFTTSIVPESEPLRINYTLSFLDEPSDLLLPQIRAVSNTSLVKKLGNISASEMSKISQYIGLILCLK